MFAPAPLYAQQGGRKITRWVDEHLLEEMAQRLQREQARFAQR